MSARAQARRLAASRVTVEPAPEDIALPIVARIAGRLAVRARRHVAVAGLIFSGITQAAPQIRPRSARTP